MMEVAVPYLQSSSALNCKCCVPFSQVKKQIEKSVAESKSGKAPVISYTDDSAMTIVMAQSLVEHGKFDASDMARRLVCKKLPSLGKK